MPVNPLVFRVLFAFAALLSLMDRTAAAILVLCVPALGIHWSNGQMSIPLAALVGEAGRALVHRNLQVPKLTMLDVSVALLVVATLLSIAAAPAPLGALYVTLQLLALVGTFVFLSRACTDERLRRTASAFLVGFATYVSAVGIGQVAFPGFRIGFQAVGPSGLVFTNARATGFFENPNTFGVMLVLCAVIALEMAMSSNSMRQASVWGAATICMVVGIELSYARAAYVGLAVGVVTLLAIRAPRTRRTGAIIAAALVILIASAAMTGALDRGVSITSLATDASSMDRVYLSRASMKMFRDSPWTGVGVGEFSRAYPNYRDSRVTVSPVTDPHQSLFSIPAETGVIGLIAEVVLLGSLVWALLRARQAVVARSAAVAGVAASVAFLAMGMLNTQHYLHSFWAALAFAGAFMLNERLLVFDGRLRTRRAQAIPRTRATRP